MNDMNHHIRWRDAIFLWFAHLAIHHKRSVFTVALLATLASVAALPYLTIRTTRQGMHSEEMVEQQRYNVFLKEFGTTTQLVVLLEGDPANITAAADEVATALAANPEWVRNVFYKVDLSFFEKEGFYFLPLEGLQKADRLLAENLAQLSALSRSTTLLDFITGVEKQSAGADADPAQADTALPVIDLALAQWQTFLTDPTRQTLALDSASLAAFWKMPDSGMVAENGYLLGKDKRSAFLFVQQSQTIDDGKYIVPFMGFCRAATAEALAAHPGVTAGFTGWPVAVEEEVGMLKRDLTIVSIFSTIFILLLLYVSFRSWTQTILIFLPLVFGVLWNTGLTYLTIGYMNYFSSVFFGLLFSMGSEYGIIFMRRFREELLLGATPEKAIEQTFLQVGPGITTSALTTVAAFLTITIFDLPAFSQMGLVSASGMFFLMAATMFLLPPLMLLFQNKIMEQSHAKVVGANLLGWTWRTIDRKPGLLIALGVGLLVASVVALPRLQFDYNLNNLLPADSETINVATRVEQISGYQSQFIAVMADDLEQARQLQAKLAALPTVARVESVATLVPEQQREKQQAMLALAGRLEQLPALRLGDEPNIPALRAKVGAFAEQLAKYQESAFSEGKTDLVTKLDGLINRLTAIRVALGEPDAAARQNAFNAALTAAAGETREKVHGMLQADPVNLAAIPPELQRRYIGATGKLAVMIFPKQDIWDVAFLDRFVDEVVATATTVLGADLAAERTTGFGVIYKKTSRMIASGFREALLLTFGAVFVLLLLDFRKLKPMLLAAMPLLVGMVLTLGLMVLFDQKLNMASQLALPVMVGIGVDFGVHIVHRWLEPDGADPAKVVVTIGGAIWLAGATNLLGFGAVMLARYRGLSTFGAILFVGILLAFSGALFGIPALIRTLRLDPRIPK